ncbi:MAG: hypothetical protein ACOCV2_04255, partial [Persicimonas sp.]
GQQTGGFGQQPQQGGQQTGGFGPQTSNFGPPGGGEGQSFDPSNEASAEQAPGAGAPAQQFGSQSNQQEASAGQEAQQESDDGAGIKSWDEIAGESDDESAQQGGGEANLAKRLQSKNNDEEETNPLLVGVAAVAIVGLTVFMFMDTGSEESEDEAVDEEIEEKKPLVVDVDCMGESECKKRAHESYQVGVEKLEKQDAALTNLFEGYKALVETEAYLEKAGVEEAPEDLEDVVSRREEARDKLDDVFRNYKVMYDQGSKSNDHDKMARALREVHARFPDSSARENKWVDEQVRKMKQERNLPDTVKLPE